jgi:hypothetical protein
MLFENKIYLISLTLGLLCCYFCRCPIEAVVVGIVAGPHAFDSCECMNIEGQTLRKTCGRLGVM